MNLALTIPPSVILVAGVAIIIGSGIAVAAIILGYEFRVSSRYHRSALWERERDIAAALGWSWRSWVALRVGVTLVALAAGAAADARAVLAARARLTKR